MTTRFPRTIVGAAGLALTAALTTLPTTAQAGTNRIYVSPTATVTAPSLLVRAHPSTAAAAINHLAKGTSFTPVCRTTGTRVGGNATWYWTGMYKQGHEGWVSGRYLTGFSVASVPTCSSFPGMHLEDVTISSPAQVASRLAFTTPGFRAMIKTLATQEQKYATRNCPVEIRVDAWWPNNQAVGSDGTCGGGRDFWWYSGGRWHDVGFNGTVMCADLRKGGLPHAIPATLDTCAVKSGSTWYDRGYTPR